MTDWLEKRVPLSLNDKLIDKVPPKNGLHKRDGFIAFDLDARQLAEAIRLGNAQAAQFRNGSKIGANFVRSGAIFLDFDSGLSLAAIRQLPFVSAHGTLLYTTASHTTDIPRCRVVTFLAKPITDRLALSQLLEFLAHECGADPRSANAVQMYYGNRKAEIEFLGNGLSEADLEKWLGRKDTWTASKVRPAKDAYGSGGPVRRSKTLLRSDEEVDVPGKGRVRLDSLPVFAKVHCPFHDDEHASGSVRVRRTGARGFYCYTCDETFWTDAPPYDFETFSKAIEAWGRGREPSLSEGGYSGSERKPESVSTLNERYLPKLRPSPGVTFIKSPKGTGKTQRLQEFLGDPNTSVLLVGHRTSLIRELTRRLNLSFYQDNCFDPARLGVCLDSIRKVPQRQYDYVVLDETEQVLAHFLSTTMAERRRSAVLHLRHLLGQAKHVIALDADLSWISYRFLGGVSEGGPPLHVMINNYMPDPSKLRLFNSKNALIRDFIHSVSVGRRSFLTSNSKADVQDISLLLKERCPEANILVVSSDTPQRTVSAFTNDIHASVLKYDAILTTPTLSTGIDISFPNDQCLIKEVYGLFVPNITSHFECDQQLARVRKPENISVFIAGADNLEIEPSVVREELKVGPLLDALISGYTPNGTVSVDETNPLLNLAVDVEVVRRASLNNLRANFVAHRTSLNTEVEEVVPDEGKGEEAKAIGDWLKDVKEQSEQLRVGKLLSASRMTVAEYEEKERSPTLSESERYSLQRFELEAFYRRPLTARLLEIDGTWRLQKRLPIYELVVSGNFAEVILYAVSLEVSADDFRSVHAVQAAKASFLQGAFLAARVLKPTDLSDRETFCHGGFDADLVLMKSDLGALVQYLKDKANLFKKVFGRSLRKNFESDPTTQIQSLLGEVGLVLSSQGGGKDNGRKVYRYRLDRERLSFIQEISEARSTNEWQGYMEGLASEYNDTTVPR